MLENTIFRDTSKSGYPLITTILGLVVFEAILGILLLIPNMGEVGTNSLGIPVATLILFFILGIPKGRNLIIVAVLSWVAFGIGIYGGILVAYASDFLSNGMVNGDAAMGIFTVMIVVVSISTYLYGKKSLGTFIIVSFIVAIIFGFFMGQLHDFARAMYSNEEIINLYDQIFDLAPIGTSLGLGVGSYNRKANS